MVVRLLMTVKAVKAVKVGYLAVSRVKLKRTRLLGESIMRKEKGRSHGVSSLSTMLAPKTMAVLPP